MGNIYILDQTLREGGYINNFLFGEHVITDIISVLSDANIDMIECGFLKSKNINSDYSLYSNVNQIQHHIKTKQADISYFAMLEVSESIPLEKLTYSQNSIDGIRISFHEHEIDEAVNYTRVLQSDGYKVFFQPVGIMSFKESSLYNLMQEVNALNPTAFYMVDTLGQMTHKDLTEMVQFLDSYLNPKIILGFHSHNNIHMSYYNAITLMEMNIRRDVIIDASLLGIGRGAGTIHTEMLAQYINTKNKKKYDITKILNLIDDYIQPIVDQYKYQYNCLYYFSAIKACHPNYVSYLVNLGSISLEEAYKIINMIADSKKSIYDKDYIETLVNSKCYKILNI